MRSHLSLAFVVIVVACAGPRGSVGMVPSIDAQPEPSRAHILGAVSNEGGKPLAHTDLRLWRFHGEDTLVAEERQIADSVGGFLFRNVAPGQYLIEARFLGMVTAWVRVRAWPDRVDTVRIDLQPAEVVVHH